MTDPQRIHILDTGFRAAMAALHQVITVYQRADALPPTHTTESWLTCTSPVCVDARKLLQVVA